MVRLIRCINSPNSLKDHHVSHFFSVQHKRPVEAAAKPLDEFQPDYAIATDHLFVYWRPLNEDVVNLLDLIFTAAALD